MDEHLRVAAVHVACLSDQVGGEGPGLFAADEHLFVDPQPRVSTRGKVAKVEEGGEVGEEGGEASGVPSR